MFSILLQSWLEGSSLFPKPLAAAPQVDRHE